MPEYVSKESTCITYSKLCCLLPLLFSSVQVLVLCFGRCVRARGAVTFSVTGDVCFYVNSNVCLKPLAPSVLICVRPGSADWPQPEGWV